MRVVKTGNLQGSTESNFMELPDVGESTPGCESLLASASSKEMMSLPVSVLR